MFTVCSKCNLRLTVTATDLRAAQGYVRCGRCHNVFNALAALADDPARLAEQTTAADTQSRQALTPPTPEPQPATVEPPQTAADTSLEFNPASTNINEVFIEAAAGERTGTFESIILGSEGLADAEVFEEPQIEPQALSAPTAPAAPAAPVPSEPVAAAPPVDDEISFMADWSVPTPSAGEPPGVNAAAASEIADALQATEATGDTATVDEPVAAALESVLLAPAHAAVRVPRWVLRGAAGVLVLALIAQVIHHYRGDLADTSGLRRPLTAIYRSLGQPLEPRWDVASYEIRQLGASTDGAAPGDLVVRASISNRAKRVQPLPLLRVVMQDRFGNRVAGRDLQPAEYLGRGAPQVSLMAPGQRVDVQVAFQDPGQAATGFEIDACMAHRDHTVSCANDPSSR
ncbi:MAG TPA: zinc-ribbon and DUF3426 domain-containing protein [Steroidobacteraceae bacterium]|nr:zinc-ribbon and DUF3426 domain-containing protein [Steroidobacteraceae bacterium]